MQNPSSQPKCCGHCLHDLPCALTYELCDTTRRNQVDEPYQPWWPASIDSPTLYFHLKRRAMDHQFREQARLGPHSTHGVWRAPNTSVSAGTANQLLVARRMRQLTLRVPATRTNICTGDELEFVGVLCSSASSMDIQAPPPPPPAALVVQQQAQQAQALPLANLQQQQQHAPAVVVRPRPRRPVPLPPAAPAAVPAASAAPPQLPLAQGQMGLLASLQYSEQCHRQQMAAAAAASLPFWSSSAFLAGEAHPASFLRPKWQQPGGWEAAEQQPLAQAYRQQQQQAAAAAAAAAAAPSSWPYSVPQPQQQGCWAYASSLAPMPCQPPLVGAGGQAGIAAVAAC